MSETLVPWRGFLFRLMRMEGGYRRVRPAESTRRMCELERALHSRIRHKIRRYRGWWLLSQGTFRLEYPDDFR